MKEKLDLEQLADLERRLMKGLKNVSPQPEFVGRLRERLIFQPQIETERHREGKAFIIIAFSLLLGSILLRLLVVRGRGKTQSNLLAS